MCGCLDQTTLMSLSKSCCSRPEVSLPTLKSCAQFQQPCCRHYSAVDNIPSFSFTSLVLAMNPPVTRYNYKYHGPYDYGQYSSLLAHQNRINSRLYNSYRYY